MILRNLERFMEDQAKLITEETLTTCDMVAKAFNIKAFIQTENNILRPLLTLTCWPQNVSYFLSYKL